LPQRVTIDRVQSSTIVLQAVAATIRRNIFQIMFLRDGSLIVNFPYGRHSKGLLSICNIPAGQATAQISLVQQGKCTSHKIKYTHHRDGRAHFSQDGKISTAGVRFRDDPCPHGAIAPRARRGAGCRGRVAAGPTDVPPPRSALAGVRVQSGARTGPPIRPDTQLGRE
jgi:hypothetical protein